MLKRGIIDFLTPDDYHPRVETITPCLLLARGIKGVIIDLDNTIVIWNDNFLRESVREWISLLKEAQIRICIASNSSNIERVQAIADDLSIPMLCRSAKPFRPSFLKAMRVLGTETDNTAVVGDQLFTDILGGNRLGLHTILVSPLSERDFVATRFMRIIEKRIMNHLAAAGRLVLFTKLPMEE